MFQACIDQGYHPKEFKQARTIALQKIGKDDYTLPGSYRPIALLECLGKVLERIIATKLAALAESYELLPQYQMGARRQRGTLTTLELLTEQIHTVWNSGNQHVASLLSLDIAGAFDNASHAWLLHILKRLRVPDWIVRWTRSFLQDRMTTIKIQTEETALFSVTNGIPQGSPISPILYLFYNEELVRACNSTGYRASATGFVDDINILTWGPTTEKNCQTLQQLHNKCLDWAVRHGATFAQKKYELIHLTRHPKRFNMNASLRLDQCRINPKTQIRVLGIELDTKLWWGPHVQKVQAKITRQAMALHRITTSTWGATFKRAKLVYTSVVRSAMTYGAPIWFSLAGTESTKANLIRKLEQTQNRCLRTIAGAYKATPTSLLESETGILPIRTYLSVLQAQYQARTKNTPVQALIKKTCKRIQTQLQGQQGCRRICKETPGNRKRV